MNLKTANIEGGRKMIGGEGLVERNKCKEYVSRRREYKNSVRDT